jgi:tetratricopeptide (TPR) repeat protein
MDQLRHAALCAVLMLFAGCNKNETAPHDASHAATAAGKGDVALADVQPDGTTAPLFHGIGPLHMAISTESEAAQKYFDQGLTLMYGFNHAEAIRSFKEAARLDPTCGICWWGVALSLGSNINLPMQPEAIPEAWKAVQEAQRLRGGETPREQAYIDAVATRYSESGEGREALDRAYADAMATLVAAYPDDLDAATLYAEALMDLSPWDYYLPGGAPKPETVIALAQIERVIAANPQHPGALHFYIHAVEATDTPERAEAAADELGDLVPVAGHLVHMPGHIYLRVGRYHDAVIANELASAADEDYIAQCNAQGFYPAMYYPHNLHFLWYAAMMEGRQKLALDTARKMSQHVPLDVAKKEGQVQQFLPVPMYTLVRFGMWNDVLTEPAPPDGVPFATAMWHYGRGVAFAHTGQLDLAAAELAAVEAAANIGDSVLVQGKPDTTNTMVAISADLVRAAIASAHADHGGEVAALERAVAAQDALQYTEPPYWYYPIRQSLGAAYLRANRAADAERVFREDLAYFKNNGWSLWGLGQALAALGQDPAATNAAQTAAWQYADVPAAQVLN